MKKIKVIVTKILDTEIEDNKEFEEFTEVLVDECISHGDILDIYVEET